MPCVLDTRVKRGSSQLISTCNCGWSAGRLMKLKWVSSTGWLGTLSEIKLRAQWPGKSHFDIERSQLILLGIHQACPSWWRLPGRPRSCWKDCHWAGLGNASGSPDRASGGLHGSKSLSFYVQTATSVTWPQIKQSVWKVLGQIPLYEE